VPHITLNSSEPGIRGLLRYRPQTGGPLSDLAETLRRVRRYADAGADGVFVPGLAEPADIAAVVAAVDVPVNILFLPGRHTVAVLSDLGVRRISTGSLLFRAALAACTDTAVAVRDGLAVRPDLPSYAQVNTWSPAS